MTKIFFFDLDGTLRETKSGATFINDPADQKPIDGASEAVVYYASQAFICIGITNQGGCAAIDPDTGNPRKSLESAIAEQRITLELFPDLSEIFFCHTWGESCYQVSRGNVPLEFGAPISGDGLKVSCRKPGHGMLLIASQALADLKDCWMTGDRPEDEQAAKNAGVNFIPAEVMLSKFSGTEMKEIGVECDRETLLKFLVI